MQLFLALWRWLLILFGLVSPATPGPPTRLEVAPHDNH